MAQYRLMTALLLTAAGVCNVFAQETEFLPDTKCASTDVPGR